MTCPPHPFHFHLCLYPISAMSPRYGALDWLCCDALPSPQEPPQVEEAVCLPGDIIERYAAWAVAQDFDPEARFTFRGVDVQRRVLDMMRAPFARLGARCGGGPPYAFWVMRDGGPCLTAMWREGGWCYEATATGASRTSILDRATAPTFGEVQEWMIATLTQKVQP